MTASTARTGLASWENRLAVLMSLRPRLSAGLVLAIVTLAAWAAPPAPEAEAKPKCGGGWRDTACEIGSWTPVGQGIKGLWGASSKTKEKIDQLHPQNFLDEWAKGLVSAVTYLLTFIQATAEKIMTPAYDQPWWIKQYAVSFGLSLLLLAFMLLLVGTRTSGQESSVSGVEMMRKGGVRLIFVYPLISMAPAILYSVQQLAVELTKTFSTEAAKKGHGAVGHMLKRFQDSGGDWGKFGGTIVVIFMCVFILLAAVIVLIELMVSNWGLLLAGLLVPIVLVAWVYPPWSQGLKKLASVIAGLMFLPVMIFFFFWTVWSAFDAMVKSSGQNSGFTILLFLLVSLIMINGSPLVGWWLLQLVTPDASGMDDGVRDMVPASQPGDTFPQRREKSVERGVDEGGESSSGGTEASDSGTATGGAASGGGLSDGGKGPTGSSGGDGDGGAGGAPGAEGGGVVGGAAAGGGGQAAAAGDGGGAAAGGEAAAAGGAGVATGGVALAAYAAKEGGDVQESAEESAGRTMREDEW